MMAKIIKKPVIGPHVVRYGISADQKYLLGDFLNTYNQLVINATMVAHIPSALASFVMQRAKNKPYFIDPQTHAFQHDIAHLESNSANSKGEIKKSCKNLLQAYGNPLERIVGQEHRSVVGEDFRNSKLRKDFCERVLEFQLKVLAEQAESSESAKYYNFLKKKGIGGNVDFSPCLLIAPYFCMESTTFDEWLPINISCSHNSKTIAAQKNKSFGVQIVISQKVLSDHNKISKLIEEYSKVSPDVFLVWVDSFSEQQSSENELGIFIELVKGLSKAAPVINLYGGFFSVLLIRLGILSGVSHGLEYGEERPVVPVGGGIPVAKYYVPKLHTRLSFRTALRAVRALGGMNSVSDFYNKVCNCKQCKKVIKENPDIDFAKYGTTKIIHGRQYPLPETKDNSVRHYMWSKAKEYKQNYDIKEVIQELVSTADNLRRDVGVENTEHCRVWAEVLAKVSG